VVGVAVRGVGRTFLIAILGCALATFFLVRLGILYRVDERLPPGSEMRYLVPPGVLRARRPMPPGEFAA
jgi:hypothetical protein